MDAQTQVAIDEAVGKHCVLDEQKHAEILEEIKKLSIEVKAMAPTVKEIKDFGTFWRVARQIGFGIAAIIFISGTISGAIYAIRSWLRN
jgi:hypothetical protein